MNGIEGLTTAQTAVVSGFLGAFLGTAICIGIAYYVLIVVSWWKLFTKAGEKGWKALIPFYNLYIQFKLTWSKKFFWIFLGLTIAQGIFSTIVQNTSGGTQVVMSFICLILVITIAVFSIISWYRLSKAYGHAGGYTVGLIFLNFIFMLILAFGSSKYQGNVYLNDKK